MPLFDADEGARVSGAQRRRSGPGCGGAQADLEAETGNAAFLGAQPGRHAAPVRQDWATTARPLACAPTSRSPTAASGGSRWDPD